LVFCFENSIAAESFDVLPMLVKPWLSQSSEWGRGEPQISAIGTDQETGFPISQKKKWCQLMKSAVEAFM